MMNISRLTYEFDIPQLSDVQKGGGTAFPYLKLLIAPRKGSAILWFNLKTSGEGDVYTRHAGCPVLLGSKWVANKWIREHGNEFRRPCLPGEFDETKPGFKPISDEFF